MSEPLANYRYFTVEAVDDALYVVRNRRSREVIAEIEWYPKWRRWVLVPCEHTVWSTDCLRDIQHFIAYRASEERSEP